MLKQDKSSISIYLVKESNERKKVVNRLSNHIKERLNSFTDQELKEMDRKLTRILEMLTDSESNYQLLNEILETLYVK